MWYMSVKYIKVRAHIQTAGVPITKSLLLLLNPLALFLPSVWLQNYFEKTDTQYKVIRALMDLWAECFGPHLIHSVWGQCVSLGGHSPDVSQRISVRQAE